jgi:prolyl oligopeptidase
MHDLMTPPPHSAVEPVTEIFHGVSVTDPYRWLEDQDSPRTRAWIEEQTRYARSYLDSIPGRERIRERIREFLAVETYDSLQRAGSRYFFRKRLADQEQPCIYMREGADGEDRLLIDPSERGTGNFTAVKPLRVSPDSRLLLYEVKEGGERTGTFELLEIETRKRLPDFLPRGYLRGFAFAPDGKSLYYVHEALGAKRPFYRAAYQHILGTPSSEDRETFFAGEDEKVRLALLSDKKRLGFFVYRFLDKTLTDIYLRPFGEAGPPTLTFAQIDYMLDLRLMDDKILAITDRNAPNRRIVEIRLQENGEHEWIDIIPESDTPIRNWLVVGDSIFVSYMKEMTHRIFIFDFSGKKIGEIPIRSDETLHMIGGSPDSDELLIGTESFNEPNGILRYSTISNQRTRWTKKNVPFF